MNSSHASQPTRAELAARLDALGRRALSEQRSAASWNALVASVRPAAVTSAVVAGVLLLFGAALWLGGASWRLPWIAAVLFTAIAPPFVVWWRWSDDREEWPDSSEAALQALDTRLHLGGRLVAAREFSLKPQGTDSVAEGDPELTLGFIEATLLDAERRLDGAERAEEAWERAEWEPDLAAAAAPLTAALALLLVLLIPAAEVHERRTLSSGDAMAQGLELEARPDAEARGESGKPEMLPEPAPTPLESRAEREPGVAGDPSEQGADVEDEARESKGSFGSGRGAQARRAKGSGQSQGAASDQAPSSLKEQKPQKPKSKPKEPGDDNKEEDRKKADKDRSGATSGAGRGVGSVKNPTASKWESKDQVVTDREEDIEEDPEVEDEDSDDENRGGLQPNLRERKPPVNRDLQISFGVGRKPPPDANGRGGKSGLKKQRGVAQLVLGVPYPDLIRGKPNPGQSKVTQERVEPRSETAAPEQAQPRMPRAAPLARNGPDRLDPWMRRAVERFFLQRRAAQPQG